MSVRFGTIVYPISVKIEFSSPSLMRARWQGKIKFSLSQMLPWLYHVPLVTVLATVLMFNLQPAVESEHWSLRRRNLMQSLSGTVTKTSNRFSLTRHVVYFQIQGAVWTDFTIWECLTIKNQYKCRKYASSNDSLNYDWPSRVNFQDLFTFLSRHCFTEPANWYNNSPQPIARKKTSKLMKFLIICLLFNLKHSI